MIKKILSWIFNKTPIVEPVSERVIHAVKPNGYDFSFLNGVNLTLAEKEAIEKVFEKLKSSINGIWHLDNSRLIARLVLNVKRCVENGAVPSVVLAQMILESGWFAHEESAEGIKATASQIHDGDAISEATHEVQKGKSIPEPGSFYQCDTPEEAFDNYFAYLKRQKPGSAKFCPLNSVGYLHYLQEEEIPAADGKPSGAYSTAGVAYIASVLRVSESNGLDAFDHV